jgi:hypothetical protein
LRGCRQGKGKRKKGGAQGADHHAQVTPSLPPW